MSGIVNVAEWESSHRATLLRIQAVFHVQKKCCRVVTESAKATYAKSGVAGVGSQEGEKVTI